MSGIMRIMGVQGDTKLIWDKNNADEVKAAEKMFDELISKRFTAFSVSEKGDKDEMIRKFDADAEKIIMVPRMQGG